MQQIEQDLKHLRDIKFKKGQEYFTAKKAEKDTNAEIQGTRAAIRNLDSKINKLDHDSLKQLEIIYNQVWSISQSTESVWLILIYMFKYNSVTV